MNKYKYLPYVIMNEWINGREKRQTLFWWTEEKRKNLEISRLNYWLVRSMFIYWNITNGYVCFIVLLKHEEVSDVISVISQLRMSQIERHRKIENYLKLPNVDVFFLFSFYSFWSQLNVLFLSTTKVFINLSIYSSIQAIHSLHRHQSFSLWKIVLFSWIKEIKNNHYIL